MRKEKTKIDNCQDTEYYNAKEIQFSEISSKLEQAQKELNIHLISFMNAAQPDLANFNIRTQTCIHDYLELSQIIESSKGFHHFNNLESASPVSQYIRTEFQSKSEFESDSELESPSDSRRVIYHSNSAIKAKDSEVDILGFLYSIYLQSTFNSRLNPPYIPIRFRSSKVENLDNALISKNSAIKNQAKDLITEYLSNVTDSLPEFNNFFYENENNDSHAFIIEGDPRLSEMMKYFKLYGDSLCKTTNLESQLSTIALILEYYSRINGEVSGFEPNCHFSFNPYLYSQLLDFNPNDIKSKLQTVAYNLSFCPPLFRACSKSPMTSLYDSVNVAIHPSINIAEYSHLRKFVGNALTIAFIGSSQKHFETMRDFCIKFEIPYIAPKSEDFISYQFPMSLGLPILYCPSTKTAPLKSNKIVTLFPPGMNNTTRPGVRSNNSILDK